MRVRVNTTHNVTLPEDDDNNFEVFVDCDGTAQLRMSGHYDSDTERAKSRWVDRRELMRLRALISRAIGLLDDTH